MHLAGGDRRVELQAVVEHALFADEAPTIFLTSGNDVQTITFLIIH